MVALLQSVPLAPQSVNGTRVAKFIPSTVRAFVIMCVKNLSGAGVSRSPRGRNIDFGCIFEYIFVTGVSHSPRGRKVNCPTRFDRTQVFIKTGAGQSENVTVCANVV